MGHIMFRGIGLEDKPDINFVGGCDTQRVNEMGFKGLGASGAIRRFISSMFR